jgi:hypothetical protein
MTKQLSNVYKFILGFLILISFSNKNFAQDTSTIDNKLYVKITLGAGIGSGYPKQNNSSGLAGLGELVINKGEKLITVGTRGISEVQLFNNISNSLSTAEITFGRLFQTYKFFFTTNLGISYITFLEQGAVIPNLSPGINFGTDYEKINYYSIGFPISIKFFPIRKKKTGLLLELFGNFNNKIDFGGINIAYQFIVYKTKNTQQTQL